MEASTFWSILSAVHYVAALIAIEHILRHRRDPRGMLAWILALLLLPVVGLVLFLLIGGMPVQRKVRKRRRRRRLIEPVLSRRPRDPALEHVDAAAPSSLTRLASRVAGCPVTRGNDLAIYHDAEATFLALSLAIEAARAHIHLQYYIFADDETGLAVRDLLVRRARAGVEVRLLLDAVGCWRLSRAFLRPLREAGAKVAFFLPWRPWARRLSLNCRNHRKLVVIDGRLGFTGSQNIGDEYLGRRRQLGPWRDTHLRLRGPAVAQLQEVFVEDWHFATGETLSPEACFPEPLREGDRDVQIVPSGPDRRPNVMHQLLSAAVWDARRHIDLLTPYFVPDHAMIVALESAACRNVRVRLILPSKSDHWLVLWAGRSSYDELLDAGVEIYEYAAGMLHSKVVVVDDRWAMVGSANMDVRSFRINFELTTILYDAGAAQQLHADFDALRAASRRVQRADVRGWSYPQTLAAGLARLATPLL
jgi:cardiolipin synthase